MDQTERSKPTRRSGLKEAAGKNITIRLPLDLYDKINSEWNKRGFKSKTDMIEHICKEYFASLPCPSCGALNPPNGVECAVCGEKLTPYYQAMEELNVVGNRVVELFNCVVLTLDKLFYYTESIEKQRDTYSTDDLKIYDKILKNIKKKIDREETNLKIYISLIPNLSLTNTSFDAEEYLKYRLEKLPHVKKNTQEIISLIHSEKENLEMIVEILNSMYKENFRLIIYTQCVGRTDESLEALASELLEEYLDFDKIEKYTDSLINPPQSDSK
ncbi:MAG TPA: hypothetical protein O0X98_02980 [Methanocorpusculum sp.]|nr:hypothetical protein [Methanocorpusculum sp.]